MMDFSPNRARKSGSENIVPMINVVFLLLIFFLMSAQIAPPDPVEITLPESTSDTEPQSMDSLYLSADGALYFFGAQDDAVWARLANRPVSEPLFIRADQNVPATILASLLPKLAAIGIDQTLLVAGHK